MAADRSMVSPAGPGALRGLAARMFARAMGQNLDNVERLAAGARPLESLLDVGCDDGANTRRWAAAAGARDLHGVEVVAERAALAEGRGIEVARVDIMGGLPYDDGRFDLVVSNQVIEHVSDTDIFVAEIHRVLRPGGLAVISTENLASWHNIASLLFGWQPFSLTNVTGRQLGIGNPLALHRGQEPIARSWQHQRVFAYRGLVELVEAHGFRVGSVLGAGYYPLPTGFTRMDPRHAAFLTVAARS
jgi:SAM-dependent methyltransferase